MSTRFEPTNEPVALVICQVEGESALRARVPMASERAFELVRRLVERLAAELGGAVLDANLPGELVAFREARAAVGFALKLQLGLLSLVWPSTLVIRPEAAEVVEDGVLLFRGLRLRVAIHHGVLLQSAAESWEGAAVDQVARLAAATTGGQITLDDAAWRAMRGNPGIPFVLRDLGQHRWPGVSGESRVLQVLPSQLDARRFPPLASLEETRTNLPVPASPWIGREGDLAALAELSGFGVRCINLVGKEGAGTSRLAHQFAWLERARFTGGGWWVRLPPLTAIPSQEASIRAAGAAGADDLLAEVAHALGVSLSHARTEEEAANQIGWSLAGRGPCHLVIDNVDGDAGVTRLLTGWLRAAPQLRLTLVAPRRLNLPSEVVYQVGAFDSTTEEGDAWRWLVHRTQALGVVVDQAAAIGVVETLAGCLTSIGLAAGILARVPAEDLLAHLGEAPGAVYELAWGTCSALERDVVRTGASFLGAFTPARLVRVVDPAANTTPAEIVAAVEDLVARGWLQVRPSAAEPARDRYAVGRLVRRFLESQPDPGRADRERRYALEVLAEGERAAARAHGREGPQTIARLAAERADLFAVARWGTADPQDPVRVDLAIRTLLVLQPLFASRGPFTTQLRLLDQSSRILDVALGADALLHVRLLHARAEALWIRGRGRNGLANLERGLAIAERWEDREGIALCRLGIGIVRSERPEGDTADQLFDVAREFGEIGSRRRQALALAAAGGCHFAAGRFPEAEAALREAIAIARQHGARRDEGRFLADLARVCWRTGRIELARGSLQEAVRIHKDSGERRREAHAASSLGDLDHLEGRLAEAARQHRHAAAVARDVGERRVEAHALGSLGWIELELNDLDASRRVLLQSLAIHRDLEDARGEGMIMGRLGLMHHLGGYLVSARDYYQRAMALLAAGGERRERAVWLSWLGALEAEEGELAEARMAFEEARRGVTALDDASALQVVDLLSGVGNLREATLCEDPEDAGYWIDPVRLHVGEVRGRRSAPPAEVRFCLRYLEALLERGFR